MRIIYQPSFPRSAWERVEPVFSFFTHSFHLQKTLAMTGAGDIIKS